MTNLQDFQGKRALVSGASQGIGRACAVELATRGAELILLSRDEKALRELAGGLPTDAGRTHRVVSADRGQLEDLRQRLSTMLDDVAPVHVFVNNSGGPPGGPIFTADLEEFDTAFTQHLVAGQLMTQLLVPGMKDAGYGRIVNVISTSVKQPIPGLGVSNTIRGAVASWAKTLATELAPHGITVNNVLPGATRTGRLTAIFEARAKRENCEPADIERQWLETIPARRFAEPEELARAVAFLASPDAGYINGINLPVDGGRLGCL